MRSNDIKTANYVPFIVFLWAIGWTLCACTADKTDETDVRIPAEFDTGTAKGATEQPWEDGDKIGVFMIESGRTLSSSAIVDNADNREYAVSAGNPAKLTAVSGDIFFPIKGEKVDFVAYYPYSAPLADYSIAVDVADQRTELAPDLLYSDGARGKSNANPRIDLTFRHVMTRMAVNVVRNPEFADMDVGSVTFRGFVAGGTFSLTDGQWTTGAAGDIAGQVTGTVGLCHMVPQGSASGRTIVIELGGDFHLYTLPDDRDLPEGKTMTYNLTVGREGVTDVAVTIEDWTEIGLSDQIVGITGGSQLEIVWEPYHDEDFTGIEILDMFDNMYSSAVVADDEGKTMTTTGLLSEGIDNIYVARVWVYYVGRKFEIPGDLISFEDGRLRLDYHSIIAKEKHLRYLSENFASQPALLAGDYFQIRDIDLRSEAWTPIGNSSAAFTGTYDGGGYKIDNINVSKQNSEHVGLFGFCRNSTLRNINIASGTVTGNNYVGGICGSMEVAEKSIQIAGCSNKAMIILRGSEGGGICGRVTVTNPSSSITGSIASITKCSNEAVINAAGTHIGGICGYFTLSGDRSTGSITNCSNRGNVQLYYHYRGGICGSMEARDNGKTEIRGCSNWGVIVGSVHVGGICGLNRAANGGTAEIIDCHNSGDVPTDQVIGGICGENISENNGTALISGCTNSGNVSGSFHTIGGICGLNYSSSPNSKSEIAKCYNSGQVKGLQYHYGGVCGVISAESSGTAVITDCTNSGKVFYAGISARESGGMCGGAQVLSNGIVTITRCGNYGQVTGNTSMGGVCGIINARGGTIKITECFNKGEIPTASLSGGICGQAYAQSNCKVEISACYNTGTITGMDQLGGVIGYVTTETGTNLISVIECYSAAKIVCDPSGNKLVGGIWGHIRQETNKESINIKNCYWGKKDSGDEYPKNVAGSRSGDYPENWQFSDSKWPSAATGWDAPGTWKTLGLWRGTPKDSYYPDLSWEY